MLSPQLWHSFYCKCNSLELSLLLFSLDLLPNCHQYRAEVPQKIWIFIFNITIYILSLCKLWNALSFCTYNWLGSLKMKMSRGHVWMRRLFNSIAFWLKEERFKAQTDHFVLLQLKERLVSEMTSMSKTEKNCYERRMPCC